MPAANLFEEANRQLVICNACRYCEGFCPVFQAIELRRDFAKGDVFYLANLCHDCRACNYACMYSPPHEFALNIPKILSEARLESYRQWTRPAFFGRAFVRRSFGALLAVAVFLIVLACAVSLIDHGTLFGRILGPGAFYRIVPYPFMVIPAIALFAYWLLVWSLGTLQFWSEANSGESSPANAKQLFQTILSILSLRYLEGGGPGCSYPGEKPSAIRRIFHSLVFWGFLFDLAATTLAFVYQDFLHWLPPYPLSSAPVIFGTVGGAALIIGTFGLIRIKLESDREPASQDAYGLDYIFLVMLMLTAASGIFVLALRETSALGMLLILHLALVAALFATAPYGKFVHALYRSLAIVKFHSESGRQQQGGHH